MALASKTIDYSTSLGASLAAPTVAESISDPGPDVYLLVVVGATPTSLTIVAPGNLPTGVANPDTVLALGANSTTVVRVDGNYRDPATNAAAITFSSVATVTACILRG